MAVKGHEVNDGRKIPKMFYMDMIGMPPGERPITKEIIDYDGKEPESFFFERVQDGGNLARFYYHSGGRDKGLKVVYPHNSKYDSDLHQYGWLVSDKDTPTDYYTVWFSQRMGMGGKILAPNKRLPKSEAQITIEPIILKAKDADDIRKAMSKSERQKLPITFYHAGRRYRREITVIVKSGAAVWPSRKATYWYTDEYKSGKSISVGIKDIRPVGSKNLDVSVADSINPKDLYKSLAKASDELAENWSERDAMRNKAGLKEVWEAMNDGDSAGPIVIGKKVESDDGPYGSMESVHFIEYEIVLRVRKGKSWDKNRIDIGWNEVRDYWQDDEGNRSRIAPRRRGRW